MTTKTLYTAFPRPGQTSFTFYPRSELRGACVSVFDDDHPARYFTGRDKQGSVSYLPLDRALVKYTKDHGRYLRTSRELELVRAAKHWWRGRRPVAWSQAQHMENPLVNCVTDPEKRLAAAVFRLVEQEA